MKFFSEDRIILRELFRRHTPVNLYFFHEQYLLSPAQISRVVERLVKHEAVTLDGSSVVLTDKGRKWIVSNRKRIFFTSPDEQYWKKPLAQVAYLERGEIKKYSPDVEKIFGHRFRFLK